VENQDYSINVLCQDEGHAIVQVSGVIDIVNGHSFRERLFAVLDEGPADVVVDLSAVSYVDTTGLEALWESAKRCRLGDRELVIFCPEGNVRQCLADSSLDEFVPTHTDLQGALGQGA
jgi:anti-sigma B factor antagonist